MGGLYWARSGAYSIRLMLVLIVSVSVCLSPNNFTSRYQPLAGAQHLIFPHGVLHILLSKMADTSPLFLHGFFFIRFCAAFQAPFFLHANMVIHFLIAVAFGL